MIWKLFAQVSSDEVGLPKTPADSSTLATILQLTFGIIGAITVLFIIITALKMVVSQGDPQAIAKARQSLIYAAIGLVITISAQLIVTFVIGRL